MNIPFTKTQLKTDKWFLLMTYFKKVYKNMIFNDLEKEVY